MRILDGILYTMLEQNIRNIKLFFVSFGNSKIGIIVTIIQ